MCVRREVPLYTIHILYMIQCECTNIEYTSIFLSIYTCLPFHIRYYINIVTSFIIYIFTLILSF